MSLYQIFIFSKNGQRVRVYDPFVTIYDVRSEKCVVAGGCKLATGWWCLRIVAAAAVFCIFSFSSAHMLLNRRVDVIPTHRSIYIYIYSRTSV